MYYRLAIRREGDHRGESPPWKWYSTVLSSLNSVLFFFHYYRVLPLDRLRVFSSSSREELKEQLLCENNGLGSNSVPAVQFLRERFNPVPEKTAEVPAHQTREQREPAAISSTTKRSCNEYSTGAHALVEKGMPVLERRREETECGAASDHDLPYSFTLSNSWPQVRAWIRLLAKVHRSELQP
ncbi:MAG TPA: hypothetical protein VF026_02310 [Ktedonobacteraceae bacterium]